MAYSNVKILETIDNSNMFSKIVSLPNLYLALKYASRGKLKYKADAKVFRLNIEYNIEDLRRDLITSNYKPGRYNKAIIEDTKRREIWIPTYRDKITQHALNIIIREYYEKIFIPDSFACIRKSCKTNTELL